LLPERAAGIAATVSGKPIRRLGPGGAGPRRWSSVDSQTASSRPKKDR